MSGLRVRTHHLPIRATLALTLCAATLEAQAVRGDLVDRGTGQPIQGAFVTLLDEAGLEVARALTGPSGTFLLQAPSAGTYRLHSKRIGFRPWESPPLALADSQTMVYRLEVDAVPVQLPAVIVRGRPHCGSTADAATVAQLWEEAREALAAVKWSQDQGELLHTVAWFERSLPRTGRQVLAQRDSGWSGKGGRPFQSVPAEQLVRDGYVVAAMGDSVDYHGPDAEVLLGDAFANTHCFSAQDGGAAHPGLVGLAFEPEPRRRLPDVTGVLWLERQTLELKFLEFNFTRLRDNSLGGRVEFAKLSSGPWIVTHWWIRTPRLDPARRRWRSPLRVLGYRETGGLVTTIASAGREVAYAGAQAVLQGAVVDSSRGGVPLPGALVWLTGSNRRSLAGDSGHFTIAGPFDGSYGVSFHHQRLDSLGITADERRVSLARGVRQQTTLFVPPESVVVRRLCPGGLRSGRQAIVGVVRDSAFAAVPRARVAVRVIATGEVQAERADTTGRFVICDVPAGPVTLSATGGATNGTVVLEFKEGGVWVDGKHLHDVTGRVWKQDIQLLEAAPPPRDQERGA